MGKRAGGDHGEKGCPKKSGGLTVKALHFRRSLVEEVIVETGFVASCHVHSLIFMLCGEGGGEGAT